MQWTQKNPAVSRGNGAVAFGMRAHPGKRLLGHDEEKLMLGFRQDDELFTLVLPPAGWDRDPMLLVDGMTEFAGEEFLGLRVVVHAPADGCAISIHFPPLLTTFRTRGQ